MVSERNKILLCKIFYFYLCMYGIILILKINESTGYSHLISLCESSLGICPLVSVSMEEIVVSTKYNIRARGNC